jgi:hypothetical protein
LCSVHTTAHIWQLILFQNINTQILGGFELTSFFFNYEHDTLIEINDKLHLLIIDRISFVENKMLTFIIGE